MSCCLITDESCYMFCEVSLFYVFCFVFGILSSVLVGHEIGYEDCLQDRLVFYDEWDVKLINQTKNHSINTAFYLILMHDEVTGCGDCLVWREEHSTSCLRCTQRVACDEDHPQRRKVDPLDWHAGNHERTVSHAGGWLQLISTRLNVL